MKEKSIAMEMLEDYKKQNKRQFIVILVLVIMWFITILFLMVAVNNKQPKHEEIAYTQISDNNIYYGM